MSYYEGTLKTLAIWCERRGIPEPEMDSVMAHIKEKYGKSLKDMNEPEIKRVNRNLEPLFRSYLGGIKRRPLPAPEPVTRVE